MINFIQTIIFTAIILLSCNNKINESENNELKSINYSISGTDSSSHLGNDNDKIIDDSIQEYNFHIEFSFSDKNDFGRYDDTLKEEIDVSFTNDFEDSLEVYFNNNLIKSGFCQTDASTSVCPLIAVINYSSIHGKKELKIISLNKKQSIKTEIIKGYRQLEIFRINDFYWKGRYSNSYSQSE